MCFWSDWSTNSRGREIELEELTINRYLFATNSCNLIKVLTFRPFFYACRFLYLSRVVGRRNEVNSTSKGREQAMAALVSTKSACEGLEKLTGDLDETDGSADDDEAAEVAKGHVLMMGEGRSPAFVLLVVTKTEKGR
jgi:hypothetical protein